MSSGVSRAVLQATGLLGTKACCAVGGGVGWREVEGEALSSIWEVRVEFEEV